MYRLLSQAFRYPSEHSVAAIEALVGARVELMDLQREHQAVFGGPLPGMLPPLEAEYEQAHVFAKVQTLADLAGFYHAFGLEPADGMHRADHIAVELEFAHVLAAKETYARERGDEEHAGICRVAYRKLLADHLGPWGIRFLALVADQARGTPFAKVAAVAQEYLLAECRELGIDAAGPALKVNAEPRPTGEDSCPVAPSGVAP